MSSRAASEFALENIFSDEYSFKINYEVGNWNFGYWSDSNPYWLKVADTKNMEG